mgnify:CR=1 FL=1
MITSHHERLDGNGYPDGLKGTEISYFARILSVADTFDAMTSNRRYQNNLSFSEALEKMKSLADEDLYDKEFLPVVVSGMIKKENLPLLKLTEKEVVDYVNSLNMKLGEVFYVSSDGRKFYHLEKL